MKIKINNNGYSQHESLLKRSISGRIPVDFTDGGMCIELYQDKSIGGEESYEILQSGDTWRIVGADKLGLYYGIGKFLHSAKWSEEYFEPMATGKVVTPACPYRALYFSIHFYNWYYMASIDELKQYLEEIFALGIQLCTCDSSSGTCR